MGKQQQVSSGDIQRKGPSKQSPSVISVGGSRMWSWPKFTAQAYRVFQGRQPDYSPKNLQEESLHVFGDMLTFGRETGTV